MTPEWGPAFSKSNVIRIVVTQERLEQKRTTAKRRAKFPAQDNIYSEEVRVTRQQGVVDYPSENIKIENRDLNIWGVSVGVLSFTKIIHIKVVSVVGFVISTTRVCVFMSRKLAL